MKYIVFEASGDDDTVVVVVECSDEDVERMFTRLEWAKSLREKDDSTAAIEYFDQVEAFEWGDWFEGWMDEHKESSRDDSFACVDEKPDFPDDEGLRVDSSYMNVSVFDWIAWTFRPKHSNSEYGTPGIDLKDLERLFRS